MNKTPTYLIFVILLISSVYALEWQSSQQAVTFYYDNSGIWNQTGSNIFPNNGANVNITGIYYGDGSGLTGIVSTNATKADLWDTYDVPSDIKNLLAIPCGNITGATSNLCTLTDTDTNTQKSTNGFYLYNNSNNILFNESQLNATIDARSISSDTNTEKSGSGLFLYNDSDNIYYNETLLNSTISALDTDTTYTNLNEFINGPGYFHHVNNLTALLVTVYAPLNYGDEWNKTYADTLYADISVVDTDTHKTTSGLYLYNNSNTNFFNETKLNSTITALDTNTQLSDAQILALGYNHTSDIKVWVNANDADTTYSLLSEFTNDVGYFHHEDNLTTLLDDNYADISVVDTDSHKAASGLYLSNTSTLMSFNETKLNSTITALDTNTQLTDSQILALGYNHTSDLKVWVNANDADTTYSLLSEFENDVGYYYTELNLTTLLDDNYADISVVDTDTHKAASGLYLSNTSTLMSFNETKLNSTITALDTDTQLTDSQILALGYNHTSDLKVWVNANDADTTYSLLSEFNNDVGYYYTELNLTTLLDDNYADISVVDTDTDTHVAASGIFLSNTSTTMSFNNALLNSTIDARDSDTTYTNLNEFINGPGYFNTETNLTSLLDNNYADISVVNTDTQDLSYDTGTDVISLTDGGSIDITEVDTDTQLSDVDILTLGYNHTSDIKTWVNANDANTQLSEETVEDFVGGMLGGTETFISVTYQDGTNDIDFVVTDNWWNADADISVDTISESKISFSTACAAGNHYYLSGNDLACEADDDTTYSLLSEFANDVGYYHAEANLTTLLDDNYMDIAQDVWVNTTGDTMTGNLDMGSNNITGAYKVGRNSTHFICFHTDGSFSIDMGYGGGCN